LLAVLVLTSVISLLAIWFYPSVQDFVASNIMWNGIRSFTDEFSAESIGSLDNLPRRAEEAVLVSIPYLDYTNEELAKIKGFVEGGGTLLLMDDYGYGNTLLAYLGVAVRFSGKPLLDPLFCYKNQWLPRIMDFAPRVKEKGINVIMLNHATALTGAAHTDIAAWSSSASFLDVNENESWDEGEPKGSFAVAARMRFGRGSIVVLSDPSVIINAMVGRDDNYDFVRCLIATEGERRLLIDRSHLTEVPLDVAKTRLAGAREALANPYALIGITAMIFAVVSRYTLWRGETIGRQEKSG